MQSQVKTVEFRVTSRELMQVKDAYNLYDTRSAIKFMFEEQYPKKELLLDLGYTSDPCHLNEDAVVIKVQARDK